MTPKKSFKEQRAGRTKFAPIPVTTLMTLVMEYGLAMTRAQECRGATIGGKMAKKAGWAAYFGYRAAANKLLRSIADWEIEHDIKKAQAL